MKNNTISLSLAIAWLAFTTFLLCIPGNNLPKVGIFKIPELDKLVHVFIFGVLSFLFCKTTNKKKWFWLVASICTIYGVAMEFVQKNWILNRSFDEMDIVADALGSFMALFFLKKQKTQSN